MLNCWDLLMGEGCERRRKAKKDSWAFELGDWVNELEKSKIGVGGHQEACV